MIYLCTVLYINILGKGSRGENPASPLPEGEGIRRKGKEEGKVAGCKTFSYLLSSIFPLLLSLSSMLLACSCGLSGLFTTQASKRGARPEVVETRYNCGSRRPSRHASRTGVGRGNTLAAAASAVHEKPTFFFLRPSFLFFYAPYFFIPYCSPSLLLLVSRRMVRGG